MRGNTQSPRPVDPRRIALGGIAGWLMARLRSTKKEPPRLALLERITLGPRQSLALVEAEGRRLLVATSTEGSPAFYALQPGRNGQPSRAAHPAAGARVSW